MASSAVPVLFPHQTFNNITHVDGGLIDNMDLGKAIEMCLKIVEKEENIIIDLVMPFSKKYHP